MIVVLAHFHYEEENKMGAKMSHYEIEKLQQMIKGMDDEELEIVVNCIPTAFCLDRIRRDLKEAEELREFIVEISKKSMEQLEKDVKKEGM